MRSCTIGLSVGGIQGEKGRLDECILHPSTKYSRNCAHHIIIVIHMYNIDQVKKSRFVVITGSLLQNTCVSCSLYVLAYICTCRPLTS